MKSAHKEGAGATSWIKNPEFCDIRRSFALSQELADCILDNIIHDVFGV